MTNPLRIWLRCFALGCVAAGPVLGLVASGFAVHTVQFLDHASRITGTITDLTPQIDERKNVNYAPIFAFKTASGETILKQSDTGSNPPGFVIGEQVSVLFNPSNPQNAKIASTAQLWLLPIVFGDLSVTATPIGIFLLHRPWIRTTPLPFFSGTTNNV